MYDSIPPPSRFGGNKTLVFLVVGGLVFLVATGVIVYQRRSKPVQKPKTQVAAVVPTPTVQAPLVMAQPSRPIATEEAPKAEPEEESKSPAKSGKRRGTRSPKSEKMGTIDAAEVNKFLKARFSQVKLCYERRLKVNPLLEGKLDLNINVATSGRVTAVGVNRDTMRDVAMLQCVKKTVRRWSFPKPQGGRVVIGKTFTFKKKS